MIKKKGKSKSAGKKAKGTAKAKGTSAKASGNEKDLNPEEVRKGISKLVQSEAEKMAQAVINVGKTGQLAQVKYLFEVAKIFPGPADGSEATADEDSLAKTLLEQLHLPTVPVTLGEDGEVVIPVQRGSEGAQGTSAQEGEGEASESQN